MQWQQEIDESEEKNASQDKVDLINKINLLFGGSKKKSEQNSEISKKRESKRKLPLSNFKYYKFALELQIIPRDF